MNQKTSAAGMFAVLLAACGGSGDNNDAPTAAAASVTILEDAAATTINVTVADPDGDTLATTIVTAPTKGTATVVSSNSFRYTPAADQNGPDQFTYQVRDPDGLTAAGIVTITVTSQPDAPTAPAATLTTNEDTVGTANATAADIDGDAVTATVFTPPARGTVVVSGMNPFTFTYTPDADENGADTFVYRVTDATGASADGTVTVTIAPRPDAPRFPALAISTLEDIAASGSLGAVDPDGDAVTITVTTGPTHGTLQVAAGGYVYTPASNYNGADNFVIVASDGALQSASTPVPVTVNPVNDAPQATDDAATVALVGPTLVDVLPNDTDVEGDALTVEIAAQPAGAVATVSSNQIVITPNPGVAGPTSLTYRVRDAGGAAGTGNVRLVIGSATPLFFTAGSPKRLWRHDFLASPELLQTPLPAGETLGRFTTSANGAWLAYASVASSPVRHRLWLKNLDDVSQPVVEIPTPGGYVSNYLRFSPDGAFLVFDDQYATTSAPSVVANIDVAGTIQNPTFTRDGSLLYYTVRFAHGGRIIKRADVQVGGAIANPVQMTADYPAGEGLGTQFVLTPDEARIVSVGQIATGPPLNTLKQAAYVTTADGSRDDARLHGPFTLPPNGAGLPVISSDSRWAIYNLSVTSGFSVSVTDLLAPGTATQVLGGQGVLRAPRVVDATTFLADGSEQGITPIRWYLGSLPLGPFPNEVATVYSLAFQPREVLAAPDTTALVIEGGSQIHVGSRTPIGTQLLLSRALTTAPLLRYGPDSRSLAVADPGESGLFVVNPKAPGWVDTLSQPSGPPAGAACLAYAGEDC